MTFQTIVRGPLVNRKPIQYSELTSEQVAAFETGWGPEGRKPGWVHEKELYFDIASRSIKSELPANLVPYKHIREIASSKSGPGTWGCDIGCVDATYALLLHKAGIGNVVMFEPNKHTVVDLPDWLHIDHRDLTLEEWPGPLFDIVVCSSTIEHIGLGRYGDPVDPCGDMKMMTAIYKMLRSDGIVIIEFPFNNHPDSVGIIRWNGCRIYNNYRKDLLFKDFTIISEANLDKYQPTWILRKRQ